MMKYLLALLAAAVLQGLLFSPAMAHKVNVFAYAEGDTILGETSFSGGRPAKNAEILVEDKNAGTVLLKTTTGEDGTFSFAVPDVAKKNRLDLLIVLVAGEGHRNEWLMQAADYLPAAAEAAPAGSPAPASVQQEQQPTALPPVDDAKLEQLVERAVAAQLGPVKRMIAELHEDGPNLQDIIGGIGYIVGIFGIIALIKTRKGGTK